MRRAFWGLVAGGMDPGAVGALAAAGGHASASRAGTPAAGIVELLQAERLVESFEAESWSGGQSDAGIMALAEPGWAASQVPPPAGVPERLGAIRERIADFSKDWERRPQSAKPWCWTGRTPTSGSIKLAAIFPGGRGLCHHRHGLVRGDLRPARGRGPCGAASRDCTGDKHGNMGLVFASRPSALRTADRADAGDIRYARSRARARALMMMIADRLSAPTHHGPGGRHPLSLYAQNAAGAAVRDRCRALHSSPRWRRWARVFVALS